MLKCLELFSGTGSFGKVAKSLGYEVLSLDLILPADIKADILEWDYKQYDKDSFDIIWASPPCTEYSILQNSWIGRVKKGELYTKEIQQRDMAEADKIVLKTLEIIKYFKPLYYFIENPMGRLKDREIMRTPVALTYYVVDYCMYSDWGYRKRTCIWTNKKNFQPLMCNKKCGNMIDGHHTNNLGNNNHKTKTFTLQERYRIPPKLIYSLLTD